MEPEFHSIPLASNQCDIEADMHELMENTLKYQTFNKNEIRYLYNSLVDNCIYFLETTYETLYNNCKNAIKHHEYRYFIENILRKARITIPLLYSIMYYIKRFRTAVKNSPDVIFGLEDGLTITEPKDLQKVFISAAILSLKFFNDRSIMNAEWTKFINISVEQINLCERQFVRLINYNLNLNAKNYYVFINDYLKKFKKSKKPTMSNCGRKTLPPMIKTSLPIENDTKIQQPSYSMDYNKISNVNHSVYNTLNNNNLSVHTNTMPVDNNNMDASMNHQYCNNNNSANAFLSITPTPSVGSQVTPTPSGERILTPVDTNPSEINYYSNGNGDNYNHSMACNPNNSNCNYYDNEGYGYNGGSNCQTQLNPPKVLFSDPISIGEQSSPQHSQNQSSSQYPYYQVNTSYSTIMRTNTDSTIIADSNYNNENRTSTYSHGITSPHFYNNSICGNSSESNLNKENDMTTLPTPKNNFVNTFSSMSYTSCSSECTIYPYNSMDDDVNMCQDFNNNNTLINNNRIPLNKLLSQNLHNHLKHKVSYSKKRKIDDEKNQPIEEKNEYKNNENEKKSQ